MLSDLALVYSENVLLWVGTVFVVGLVVGSFLNVVIYRLPLMLEREWRAQAADMLADSDTRAPDAVGTTDVVGKASPPLTLSSPPSACPACKAPIRPWQNVPLVSWLMLKGRCAACRAPISARYPLVELTTGVLSAWVAFHFGFGASAVCALLVTWVLIALTGIDLEHQLLPDSLTLPLLWAGLVAAVAVGPGSGAALPVTPQDAIIGAAAGYLSLWLVFHAFRLLTGKEGMGYGDFKLFGALGAWLGWQLLPLIILLSAATGAVVGIALIALRGRDRAAPMPFGPYLAAAGWLAMLYGDSLVSVYLRVSGLRH